MDNKIIQILIENILATKEYTLEGISYHTRIPLDVIIDAVVGKSTHLSITSWIRIVDLYLQTNPESTQILIDKICHMKELYSNPISTLLNE